MDDKNTFKYFIDNSIFPGIHYDFDHQCKLEFGANASHCKSNNKKVITIIISKMISIIYLYILFFLNKKKDECTELWCKEKDEASCVTKGQIVSEGTICGANFNFVKLFNLIIQSFLFFININFSFKYLFQ